MRPVCWFSHLCKLFFACILYDFVLTCWSFIHPFTSICYYLSALHWSELQCSSCQVPRTPKGRDFQPMDSIIDPWIRAQLCMVSPSIIETTSRRMSRASTALRTSNGICCNRMNFSTGWLQDLIPSFRVTFESGFFQRYRGLANAAVYISDWIFRLPKNHFRK